MLAVIGVLNESFTESLRGFYRLRQAFNTLYEIMEAEKKYMKTHFSESKTSLSTSSISGKSSESGSDLAPAENENTRDADQDLSGQLDKKLDLHEEGTRSSTSASQAKDDVDFRTITDDPVGSQMFRYGKEREHPSDCVLDRSIHTLRDRTMLWTVAVAAVHGTSSFFQASIDLFVSRRSRDWLESALESDKLYYEHQWWFRYASCPSPCVF